MKNNRKLTAIVSIFLIGFLVAIALFLDIDIKEFVVYSILAAVGAILGISSIFLTLFYYFAMKIKNW